MLFSGIGLIVALIVLVLAFGPKEPIITEVTFDEAVLGDDLDKYLETTEARIEGIKDGLQKQIIWNGAVGEATEYVIVHLHGYSASLVDLRPVPDRLAKELGANLYFARLAGHATNPPTMSTVDMGDWMNDAAEAMAIGRRLGQKIIITSSSTGGTLSVAIANSPELREGLAGLAMTAPNFKVANRTAVLANWGLARYWIPKLAGEWREWEPRTPEQQHGWTTRYKTVSVLPMMALVRHVNEIDFEALKTPALFVYSLKDVVVDAVQTTKIANRWGGPKQIELVEMGEGDDEGEHVIAGDIASPGQNDKMVRLMSEWASGLK